MHRWREPWESQHGSSHDSRVGEWSEGGLAGRYYNIPKEVFFNLDETGCCLLPVRKHPGGQKGSAQISVLARDDRRQSTVVPVFTAAGRVSE